MMKKTALCSICLLIATHAYAINATESPEKKAASAFQAQIVAQPTDHATVEAANRTEESEAVYFTDTLKVVPATIQETNERYHYQIHATFPQINGKDAAANKNVQEFNKFVRNIAKQEITQFKKYVVADHVHAQTLAEDARNNSFRLDYDMDVVKPGKNAILSVRLSMEGMQAGRAHPYHDYHALNFDLASGKALALASLFKTNPNYLKFIAKYCQQKLGEKLTDKWMIAEGTKPVLKNFKNWNLQTDSLLITFDEYQVAPYVNGPQEVEIPYSALKQVLAVKSSVYPCINKPDICTGEKTVA